MAKQFAASPQSSSTCTVSSDSSLSNCKKHIQSDLTYELDATSDEDPWTLPVSSQQHALSMIESSLNSVIENMVVGQPLTISLHRRQTQRASPCSSQGSSLDFHEEAPIRANISFPGKTPEEAWRFTVVVSLFDLIHEALVHGNLISKRDMFYKDPALFGTQGLVDRLVDDIAYTFRVPRSALNVTAAAKGLVAGALTIHRRGSTLLTSTDCSSDPEGTLITPVQSADYFDASRAEFVLVVEKEAVFRAIASSPTIWRTVSQRAVLVTGKGYADMSTRALLNRLASQPSTHCLQMPIYALVDFDPDGIAILSTYKHGSAALAHEGSHLVTPTMQWLGIRAGDVRAADVLLPLSIRDRRKAIAMLGWPRFAEGNEDSVFTGSEERRELQVMLMLNVKAEVEMLYTRPGGLGRWFQERFER